MRVLDNLLVPPDKNINAGQGTDDEEDGTADDDQHIYVKELRRRTDRL